MFPPRWSIRLAAQMRIWEAWAKAGGLGSLHVPWEHWQWKIRVHVLLAIEHGLWATQLVQWAVDHALWTTQHVLLSIEHILWSTETNLRPIQHVVWPIEHVLVAIEHAQQFTDHILWPLEPVLWGTWHFQQPIECGRRGHGTCSLNN